MLPVTGKYNSMVIAKNLTMDIVSFNRYNPDFDKRLAATGQYQLRLPPEKMKLFIANKYDILNECVQVLLGDMTVPPNRTTNPFRRNKTILD
jgi:membrane-bound lytic murein transglycosylase D